MRILAITGLALYGVANLFAGVYDLAGERRLPIGMGCAVLATGLILIVAAALALRRSALALRTTVAGLVLAAAVALFNERVLGFGHPSHHIIRGLYSVLVFWASFKSLRHFGGKVVNSKDAA